MRPALLLLAISGLVLASETNETADETTERLRRVDRRVHSQLPDAQAAAPFGENVRPTFRQFIKEQLPPSPPPVIPVPVVPVVEEVTTQSTVSTTTETTVEEAEILAPEIPA